MNAALRVAALTRGRDVPSSRFRVRQYIEPLRAEGIEVREHVPWRPAHRLVGRGQAGAYALALATRTTALAATRSADVTLLQRELVSTYATLESWAKPPRVLDVDDAIYLKRDGKAATAIARIARGCKLVVAGNETLATWFRQHAPRVEIIPTAVDTARYTPVPRSTARIADTADPAAGLVLGWIGTRANLHNLAAIQEPLRRVLASNPEVRLRVVAEAPPDLPRLPPAQVEFVPWTPDGEVDLLHGFTVGLMPLEDTPWNRGKCAFKMLQYMAVGIPVAVAPVGFNRDVLAHGEVGMVAQTPRDWERALQTLIDDESLRARTGANGRRVAVASFSVAAVAPRLASALRSVT